MPEEETAIAANSASVAVVEKLRTLKKKLVFAESCTAGLAADLVASIPGASEVFFGSLVTYTQDAKIKILGVNEIILKNKGAVSREAACAMAEGALERSGADFAVSVTGLAGPLGDGSETPVGTVWIGLTRQCGKAEARVFHFTGSRNEVRREAAEKVLKEFLWYIDKD